jgi:endonuclease/exonuclease/phosphatase family metal-dependent hydrolase
MSPKNSEYSVMTSNLRFGLAEDGENSWENRKSIFREIFKRYPATFLGVQESNHFQTRFLIKCLKDHSYIGWHNPLNERWQSNLIFYENSWQCLENKHFFLSETPTVESKMQDSKWPRQCVIGLFQKESQRVIIANTHFDFDSLVQEKSAQLVVGFLSQFPSDCPVIITGDFNSNPDCKASDFFRDNGFSEVFDSMHSTTFHKFAGVETNDHLDWILHRGDVQVVSKKIVKDSISGRYPSDHYPVIATFSNLPR